MKRFSPQRKRDVRNSHPPGMENLFSGKADNQVLKIDGHDVRFSNLNKILWPKEKITKRDLLYYYFSISPFLLPYLTGRPQSLHRFPNGIEEEGFFQKNITGKVPDWIDKYPYTTEGEQKNFMLCNRLADLLFIVNMGCIDFHPWNSRVTSPGKPDYCVMDLDPSEETTFDQVIQTALTIYEILRTSDINCYCKTSGSRGMHIYIPLGARYSFEDSRELAKTIAASVNNMLPEITTTEHTIIKRKKKLYLDCMQNKVQATVASPYSIRPKPGAAVSMPLDWDEVRPGLKMTDFNISNALKRVNEKGDIFKGVLAEGIDLKKAMKKLAG